MNKTGKGGFKDRPEDINRKGVPKKDETWEAMYKRVLNEEMENNPGMTKKEALIRVSIRQAATDPRYLKIIQERMEGKPGQRVELNIPYLETIRELREARGLKEEKEKTKKGLNIANEINSIEEIDNVKEKKVIPFLKRVKNE